MQTLQYKILERFCSEKDLKDLIEEYKMARYRSREMKKPSASDVRIAGHIKTTHSVTKTAKALGTSNSRIHGALARVAAYRG